MLPATPSQSCRRNRRTGRQYCSPAYHVTHANYNTSRFILIGRFCYPCAQGFQPKSTTCRLCNHTGGAFKRAGPEQPVSWVHCICANWIPEVGEDPCKDAKRGPLVLLEKVLKAREKLKCSCCGGKANCVQCSNAHCRAAVHPYCMTQEGSGFTWRVIESTTKDGFSDYQRQLFCAKHVDDVARPLKKKGEMLIAVS
jgi:hypothetical protein